MGRSEDVRDGAGKLLDRVLEHPESDITAGDLTSMARWSSCAERETWWLDRRVRGGVGLKGLGIVVLPMGVDRDLRAHAGVGVCARWDRTAILLLFKRVHHIK